MEYCLITVHANNNIFAIFVQKGIHSKKSPLFKKLYSDLVGLEISLDIKLM
jgi:hypothetical protein